MNYTFRALPGDVIPTLANQVQTSDLINVFGRIGQQIAPGFTTPNYSFRADVDGSNVISASTDAIGTIALLQDQLLIPSPRPGGNSVIFLTHDLPAGNIGKDGPAARPDTRIKNVGDSNSDIQILAGSKPGPISKRVSTEVDRAFVELFNASSTASTTVANIESYVELSTINESVDNAFQAKN